MPISYSLDFATLVDGVAQELVRDVAFDAQGNMYVTGGTQDFNGIPITAGNDYRTHGGKISYGNGAPHDVFIQKYDPSGNLVWSTQVGGDNYDRAYALEVDNNGSVYVAGRAGENFYTTSGVLQQKFGGNYWSDGTVNPHYGKQDGFVLKLDADTGKMDWSTYFGGTGGEIIRDIDVGPDGTIYIAQTWVNTDVRQHVTSDAAFTDIHGSSDVIFAQLSNDGTTLKYGTYLGGYNDQIVGGGNPAVIIDNNGDANIVMYMNSTGAFTTPGAFQTDKQGQTDMYVVKFDGATGNTDIKSATYFGGKTGREEMETHSLAVDAHGNMIISGLTTSSDLPVTAGAFQTIHGGGADGFISIISADGKTLLASTYFGGSQRDHIEGIVVKDDGIYVTGATASADLPVTDTTTFGGFSGGGANGYDAFFAKFSSDLSTLEYATYLGGSDDEEARSLDVADNGDILIGGWTFSSDFDLKNPVDGVLDGGAAGFVMKLTQDGLTPPPPPTNTNPVAKNDSAQTDEDVSVTVNVLANDTDADGDALSVLSLGNAAHGSVKVNANNTITYTPNAGYFGSDSFVYTASDGKGGQDSATVSVTVNQVVAPPVNTLPVAAPDSAQTNQNTSVTINVLANDTDADGDSLRVLNPGSPAHGTAVVNANNTITYTPNTGYFGSDSFTYRIGDGHGGQDTAAVSITVNQVAQTNIKPVINPDFAQTTEGKSVTIDVLANDTDQDGDTLVVSNVGSPANGKISLNQDNTITYTPNAGFVGIDTFRYQGWDGHPKGAESTTVTVTVSPAPQANSAPRTVADFAEIEQDTSVTVNVLANDTDPDGDTLTVFELGNVQNGTASINADNTITYTPNSGFFGEDMFSYRITDGHGGLETGWLTVTVNQSHTPSTVGTLIDFSADFNKGTDGLIYSDKVFGTAESSLVSGARNSEMLEVTIGDHVRGNFSNGLSGGWEYAFTLDQQQEVSVTFDYNLTMTASYEPVEYAEALVQLDGKLAGYNGQDFIAHINGTQSSTVKSTTGWQNVTVDLGVLEAGDHVLDIGAYNNARSAGDEFTTFQFDNLHVVGQDVDSVAGKMIQASAFDTSDDAASLISATSVGPVSSVADVEMQKFSQGLSEMIGSELKYINDSLLTKLVGMPTANHTSQLLAANPLDTFGPAESSFDFGGSGLASDIGIDDPSDLQDADGFTPATNQSHELGVLYG